MVCLYNLDNRYLAGMGSCRKKDFSVWKCECGHNSTAGTISCEWFLQIFIQFDSKPASLLLNPIEIMLRCYLYPTFFVSSHVFTIHSLL